MKKKIIFILLFYLISLSSYSSEKIVYLDVEKIMQESIVGKSIIDKLKKRESSISQFKKQKKLYLKKKKKLIFKKMFSVTRNLEKNLKI